MPVPGRILKTHPKAIHLGRAFIDARSTLFRDGHYLLSRTTKTRLAEFYSDRYRLCRFCRGERKLPLFCNKAGATADHKLWRNSHLPNTVDYFQKANCVPVTTL